VPSVERAERPWSVLFVRMHPLLPLLLCDALGRFTMDALSVVLCETSIVDGWNFIDERKILEKTLEKRKRNWSRATQTTLLVREQP
jgi:hypothetical protein